jgi:hypothetical protein
LSTRACLRENDRPTSAQKRAALTRWHDRVDLGIVSCVIALLAWGALEVAKRF